MANKGDDDIVSSTTPRRDNHTNGNTDDNLQHATRRGNSSRQCGKPPAAAVGVAGAAPVPLQLLPPSQRVHFRLMWQSAPQGFIVLVQIGLGLLPMAADAVRPAAAPGWSPLPPPLEAIKLHFEAAQKFA